ncbi:MAG TPA: NAD(P)-dependent alcohol dehydrogenase [Polyangiales bacterium]|nr:NAD(P)-dependent alcohol dehydrogenase [Polyangiales bacterium]
MQAALYDRYGSADVAHVRDIARPRVRGGEVLVRIEAAALNPKDVVIRSGRFRVVSGGKFPKHLGFDLVGRVVELGWRVPTAFAGARVFGFYTGTRALRGSIAEFAAISAHHICAIPNDLDAAAAAATPLAGSTALQALRDDARLQPGQRVLIVGASGGVGTFAVQIAKLLGAHVTASASARNAELLRSLGADEVLDRASAAPLGSGPYDAVLDCFGKLRAKHLRSVLARSGRFVTLVPKLEIVRDVALGTLRSPATVLTSVTPRTSDLCLLAGWIADGRLKPVIDRVYPLTDLHDAMRHLESRRARGKIDISLGAISTSKAVARS